ncbi:MAG: single-stranded-DNA-specific exonuclease RecJ, partial [Verrucomicrobiota bacterium]
MSRPWKLKPVDEKSVRETADLSGLPIPLARALVLRGHHASDEIEAFLNPRLASLADPFLLPGMHHAVSRLWKAIDAAEVITIFGDYDVDGVTSAAVLVRVLSALGANVKPFIPDRIDEGYGLSLEALERCLSEHGSTLVVTVDCGTNSEDSIAFARANGVDVVVTDHHEPDGIASSAFALVNPKLGTARELEDLSGVGVAFKLAHALLKSGRDAGRETAANVDLRNYLDFVALGTVADIVPLVEENRIIVRHGLAALDATKWKGLRALKTVAGMRGKADVYHLGFQLGPRINAAGRIGQPMQALQLLITEDATEARRIAKLLDDTNSERRRIEKEMAEQAFSEIDGYFNPASHFGLVIARENWHPGVVGIVASRVSRHYNRPSIVLGVDADGCAQGSCRSIGEFDMLQGLQTCEQHLATFGGHKMAAGLTLESGALEAFKQDFNAAAASVLKDADLAPVQYIDAIVSVDEVDWDFHGQLKRLQPFGQDNPEPVWALENVCISGTPRVVGQNHLKFSVISGSSQLDAIAFNYALEQLPTGPLDIAFTLKENSWNGNDTLQLQVKDIRPAGS